MFNNRISENTEFKFGSINQANPSNNAKPNLSSELSEEDRAFFLVLDMVFSQFNHPADLGYYYECECESTFSFKNLFIAAEHFVQFECNQAIRANQRILVKYVNVASSAQSVPEPSSKQVKASIFREFNLIKKFQKTNKNPGLIQIYFSCSRVPNVYFIFFEKPDETLEEFIQRRGSNTIKRYHQDSSGRPVNSGTRISYSEARHIMKSVGNTLLILHQEGVIHGSLCPNSIFIFNKSNINQNQDSQNSRNIGSNLADTMVIKLANFTFSTIFDHSQNDDMVDTQQSMVEEVLKNRELNSLFEIGTRIAENTDFSGSNERENYMEVLKIIANNAVDMMEMEADFEAMNQKNSRRNETRSARSSQMGSIDATGFKPSSDRRLEFFVDSLWNNCPN